MKQVPIKLGPVALLLTVITICLTVMAILTLTTAAADQAMANRFADSAQIRFSLEAEGQQFLQQADEQLSGGGELQDLPDVRAAGNSVEKVFEQEGYQLTIRLRPEGDSDYTVTRWSLEKKWKEKETIDGLWMPQF